MKQKKQTKKKVKISNKWSSGENPKVNLIVNKKPVKKRVGKKKVVIRKIIEHCDEPNCVECNIKAYDKGKNDAIETIIYNLKRHKELGYELQTAIEFLENPYNLKMQEAIHRSNVIARKRDIELAKLDAENDKLCGQELVRKHLEEMAQLELDIAKERLYPTTKLSFWDRVKSFFRCCKEYTKQLRP